MGAPKALLRVGRLTAVEHAVAVVREGVDGGPVCVVAARGQRLPVLAAAVVEDAEEFPGPLAALASGLAELAGSCEAAFACGVDTPLLVPELVRAVLGALQDGDDAVVPVVGLRRQPLLAAYRVGIEPQLRELLDGGAKGLNVALESLAVRSLSEQELLADVELARVDPALRSVLNANTPEDWRRLGQPPI